MTTETESPFLTDRDLAKRWAVSLRTLNNYRRQGRCPPYIMIGPKRKYRLKDVEAFEERMLQNPGGSQ